MKFDKFEDVFSVHPKVKELYIVEGQPFIDKTQALNQAGGNEENITVVKRPVKKAKAPKKLTAAQQKAADKKAAEAKAAADKAAAEAAADAKSSAEK